MNVKGCLYSPIQMKRGSSCDCRAPNRSVRSAPNQYNMLGLYTTRAWDNHTYLRWSMMGPLLGLTLRARSIINAPLKDSRGPSLSPNKYTDPITKGHRNAFLRNPAHKIATHELGDGLGLWINAASANRSSMQCLGHNGDWSLYRLYFPCWPITA